MGFTTLAYADDEADPEQKIAHLRESSRELAELAGQPFPEGLTPEQESQAAAYRLWLADASARLEDLADRWDEARLAGRAGAPTRRSLEGKSEQPRASRAPTAATSETRSSGRIMSGAEHMQEMNLSFNLQYLQIQQKLQEDNRQFTLISNIMKTKHDTAKNAISNVR